jgi:hypothetical protein
MVERPKIMALMDGYLDSRTAHGWLRGGERSSATTPNHTALRPTGLKQDLFSYGIFSPFVNLNFLRLPSTFSATMKVS